MDGNRFDDFTRTLGTTTSRRAALRAAAGGFLAAMGLGRAADAQVSQIYCGNVVCAGDPNRCNDGCVCCVYTNPITGRVMNSRCRPPGTCSPGTEIVPTPACPIGHQYCQNLGRCAECCADTDCDTGDICTTSTCIDGACSPEASVCSPDEVCNPDTGECSCPGIPCNNGSCCPDGTFCCSFGQNCINGCCAGEVAPSGFCCLGEVNSEGVCCEGNIACGPLCCDGDTQECSGDLKSCVTVRACPIGFEEVNGACFRIVPSLDYCRGRVKEVCGESCTNCIGSVDGSSNYLCARATDYSCPSGDSGQCIPGYSACYTGQNDCFAAC